MFEKVKTKIQELSEKALSVITGGMEYVRKRDDQASKRKRKKAPSAHTRER